MNCQNFQSGYCMVTYNVINTDLCGILSSTLVWFSSKDHKLSTFDTDLCKMMQSKSCKFQKSRQGQLQSLFYITHVCNRPYWSLLHGAMPVQIGTDYSSLWLLHRGLVNSERDIQLRCAWQCWSQIICEMFHLELVNLRNFSQIGCQNS